MKKSPVDVLVTEWAYRCKKGYPDINNVEDKKVLEKIMKEWNLAEEVNNTTSQITGTDLEVLREALIKIKEDYAKYLAVFYYFDPNSLGTISEVLLAKLLDTQENISAHHTGGSQGLDDLRVNGKTISLKTTASGKYLGLGSDTVEVSVEENKKVVDALNAIETDTLLNTNVEDLKGKLGQDVYSTVYRRLEAVAKKIAGSSQDDFFVWVEKVYKGKLLTGIKIHTLNYDRDRVLEEFRKGYLYVTKKAWGLLNTDKDVVIQADLTGKVLNISPAFIRSTSKDTVIPVELNTEGVSAKIDPHKDVSDKMLRALDQIYGEIIKPTV